MNKLIHTLLIGQKEIIKMVDAIIIGDFHWDALDAIKQYAETQWILDFINKLPHLDLIVIAGDYFDCKILLNSRSSIYAIKWMSELQKICKRKNIKIRIVRGTTSHDNNQLDAFNGYEAENPDQFQIIREIYGKISRYFI